MKIKLSPQGNRQDRLESLEVQGDILKVNGTEYDLSVIPEGATLENASEATGNELFAGNIENKDGEYHVTLFLPFYGLPQTREVLFPEEINITTGIVNLPKVRYD